MDAARTSRHRERAIEQPPVQLVEGSLYALPNPYELNGLVSSHPVDAEGHAATMSYLLVEEDAALLIDTGYTAHTENLITQLESVIDPSTPLSIFPLSLSEFLSLANVRPVVERFNVEVMYGTLENATEWVDFRPEFVPYGKPVGTGTLEGIESRACSSAGSFAFGGRAQREIVSIPPPLRLLPSHWLYDAATKTLFTGDSFAYLWRDNPDGPWIFGQGEPRPALDDVYDFLVRSRFWWLPGSDVEPLRKNLDAVFADHHVEPSSRREPGASSEAGRRPSSIWT